MKLITWLKTHIWPWSKITYLREMLDERRSQCNALAKREGELNANLKLLQQDVARCAKLLGYISIDNKVEDAIKDLAAERDLQWISVKDRLPENKKLITPYHYLICIFAGKEVVEAAWAESCASTKEHPDWDFFDIHRHGERISLSYVTHWMPLPEPAKEQP